MGNQPSKITIPNIFPENPDEEINVELSGTSSMFDHYGKNIMESLKQSNIKIIKATGLPALNTIWENKQGYVRKIFID